MRILSAVFQVPSGTMVDVAITTTVVARWGEWWCTFLLLTTPQCHVRLSASRGWVGFFLHGTTDSQALGKSTLSSQALRSMKMALLAYDVDICMMFFTPRVCQDTAKVAAKLQLQ